MARFRGSARFDASRAGSTLGLLAPLLLVSLLTCGCGRVGLELLPRDAGEDAALDEMDAGSDAGEEMDGAALDGGASDAESVPKVDGCALSEAGVCQACIQEGFKSQQACGVGYCRSTSQCPEAGIELACIPGNPHAPTDTTCDGVDDNCNGTDDEDYVGTSSSCGSGLCARMGAANTCVAGSVRENCVPGAPTSTLDDATGSGNGVDDDCDGRIDEDVSPCDTTPRTFEVGVYPNIAVPMGCTSATIQLWGGAGGAGSQAGISDVAPGGRGGSGGYARSTLMMLSGPLSLFVGNGGGGNPLICVTAGTNPGAATYNGGRGGGGAGAAGAPEGMVAAGGSGASNLFGKTGGRGNFGGGGGGESNGDPVNGGSILLRSGGGGGAASVAMLNGMRVMVAGGGGGGGGAASLVYSFGEQGGNGGEGCSGSGTAGAGPRTGGGGGGGACVGTTTSAGTSGRPANANLVPAPRARGSNADCAAGGDGYAIVTFAR